MFLIGFLSLAAVGGAAYAMSDAFAADDEPEDNDISYENPDDISDGNYLEVGENVEEPATLEPSTGTIISEFEGGLVIGGTDDVDELTGQQGDDQINGYDGDDTIKGNDGDDVLYGGDGMDTVSGSQGDDVLHGEGGDDLLTGDEGDDAIYGHFGEDQLDGGEGDDKLFGGQDNDTLTGGEGDDALQGGFGDDMLDGGAGEDTLFGGDGDDVLTGEDGEGEQAADFLNGGDGEDTILAESTDIVTGGDGDDQIILTPESGVEPVTVMDFQPGQDKLFISWEGQEDPEIRLETDANDENLTHVLIDGQNVAQLLGAEGLTAEDIQLINEADLAQLCAIG